MEDAGRLGLQRQLPGPDDSSAAGDRVRIIFENRLPESTSLHWHGLEVPIEQDGGRGSAKSPSRHGEKLRLRFTVLRRTFFYHAHSAMQEMMGLLDFSSRIRKKNFRRAWITTMNRSAGMGCAAGKHRSQHASMEFNWLTFNGVSAAELTTPLLAQLGSRVRLAS